MKAKMKIYIVAIVAVLGILSVIAIPGMVASLEVMISNGQESCITAPYAWNCICAENEDKIWASGGIIGHKYECVPIQSSEYSFPMNIAFDAMGFMDADSRAGALSYAREYLFNSGCSTDCAGQIEFIVIPAQSELNQYIYVECRQPETETSGSIPWRIIFSVEDGSLHPNLDSNCDGNRIY